MRALNLRTLSVLAALSSPAAWAQGGPPMITDNTGTPGDGTIEIIASTAFVREVPVTAWILPGLEINYGPSGTTQVGLTLSLERTVRDGAGSGSPIGLIGVGGKWRVTESGRFSASIAPALAFAEPLVAEFGLFGKGTLVSLPAQAQWDTGPLTLIAEAGGLFSFGGASAWVYGVLVARDLGGWLAQVELNGASSEELGSGHLVNAGTAVSLGERSALLLSIGTSVAGGVDLLSYAGIQLLL